MANAHDAPRAPKAGRPARPEFIEVAAGLVFRERRLLITRRYAHAHQGGLWEFPGGKRHSDESFEVCLQRELAEELGIRVEVQELVQSIVHKYPEHTVLLKFFRCAWREHEPQKLGCLDFQWITREELDSYEFPPADARLLSTLRERAELW